MDQSDLRKSVRKSNRKWIIRSILGAFFLLSVGVCSLPYYVNFIFGPFPLKDSSAAGVTAARDSVKYWMKITGEKMDYTGFQDTTTSETGAESVDSSYYFLTLQDGLLLVKMDGNITAANLPATQSGWLMDITPTEKEKIVDAMKANNPADAEKILPVKLVNGNFRSGGWEGILMGLGGWTACTLAMITAIRRNRHPELHPNYKRLVVFGPIEETASQIELEMVAPHTQLTRCT